MSDIPKISKYYSIHEGQTNISCSYHSWTEVIFSCTHTQKHTPINTQEYYQLLLLSTTVSQFHISESSENSNVTQTSINSPLVYIIYTYLQGRNHWNYNDAAGCLQTFRMKYAIYGWFRITSKTIFPGTIIFKLNTSKQKKIIIVQHKNWH